MTITITPGPTMYHWLGIAFKNLRQLIMFDVFLTVVIVIGICATISVIKDIMGGKK